MQPDETPQPPTDETPPPEPEVIEAHVIPGFVPEPPPPAEELKEEPRAEREKG
jgi:hypothetical protein